MNFVDRFISEENFGDFELDEVDFSDIAFGIIIGNLERIQEFSSDFLENLKRCKDLRDDVKVVLLGRVFKIIEIKASNIRTKDRQAELSLINSFSTATSILIPIITNLKELADYIKPTYTTSFNAINFFKGNNSIILPALSAYPLKNIFNLSNNLFIYEPQDLEYIHKNSFENIEKNLQLIKTGCMLVKESSLPNNDILSIVTYRMLLEYLGFLVNNEICFSFEDVQELLSEFSKNFSYNQMSNIVNVLVDLEINYSVKFRMENESRNENNYEGKGWNKEQKGFDRPCPDSNEADIVYYQNELRQEDYDDQDYKRSNNRFSRDSRRNERYFGRRFNGRVSRNNYVNREIDSDLPITEELKGILNDIRDNYTENISKEFIIERLSPYVLSNQTAVYKFFYFYSYNEKYFSEKNIIAWSIIGEALEKIDQFRQDYLEHIKSNIKKIKNKKWY